MMTTAANATTIINRTVRYSVQLETKSVYIRSISFILNTSLIPCGKFRSPYRGKATAAARAALPISSYNLSVGQVFSNVQQLYDCQSYF